MDFNKINCTLNIYIGKSSFVVNLKKVDEFQRMSMICRWNYKMSEMWLQDSILSNTFVLAKLYSSLGFFDRIL